MLGSKKMRYLVWMGLGVFGVCCGFTATAVADDSYVAWKRQLGTEKDEFAVGVAADNMGHVYMAGVTTGAIAGATQGSYDAWVAKYAADGRRLWKRQLGTASYERVGGVTTDASGNVYLTGYTQGSLGSANQGRNDVWVAKFAADGRRLWKRQLGTATDDWATGIATDAFGGVYLTGYTFGALGGPKHGSHPFWEDPWVAKYDASGKLLWTQQLGTEESDGATGVATHTDIAGHVSIYLTGYTNGAFGGSNQGSEDIWVAKLDAAGNPQWIHQLGSADPEEPKGLAVDAVGNVYLTGWTLGSLGGPYIDYWDAWMAKYDADGGLAWVKQILATSEDDTGWGVATDAAGYVYVCGHTGSSIVGANKGYNDAWLAKYDADGDRIWARQPGTENWDSAYGVTTDMAGNVYLVGGTSGSFGGANQGGDDAWLMKLSKRP